MTDSLNLEQLKERLAKLGVHVSPNSIADSTASRPQKPSSEGATRRSLAAQFERHKTDVVELLDRCTKVEAGLNNASVAVHEAKDAVHEASAASQALVERVPSPQTKSTKKTGKASTKPKKPTNTNDKLILRSPDIASSPQPTRPRSAGGGHTPLASVLAQYKEAETFWAQEKARLRREAVTHRKKASKLELELQRVTRLHEHRGLDMKALKAALKSRDQQIQSLTARVKELEDVNARVQEMAAEKVSSVAAERDDLKALLLATLQRLEAVEEVVHRADVSSAMMEEKVKVLEVERGRAVEAAARARAEAEELAESKKRLQWQSRLLEKMSEVQLNHNRRKSAAIKELLHTESSMEQLVPPTPSSAPSETDDELLAKYADALSPRRSKPAFATQI